MIGVNVFIHIKYDIPANKNMMPPIQDHFQERIRIATTINAGIISPRSRTKLIKKIHEILGIHGRRRSKKVMITFIIVSVKS
jgi:hypothetical protein